MGLQIIANIFDTLGTLFIAFAALRVHHRVLHEHAIDAQVEKSMKFEQAFGIVGVFFVIISFSIELIIHFV